MRRIDRRRRRLGKHLNEVLQGVVAAAAALAVGNARLAEVRIARTLASAAALAETIAKMDSDTSGYWRQPRQQLCDSGTQPLLQASGRVGFRHLRETSPASVPRAPCLPGGGLSVDT